MATAAVTGIPLSKLKNETHVQMHESVSQLIVKTGVENLEIETFHALYQTALGNEKQALDYIRQSELTEHIVAQDRVRDTVFRGFSTVIKGLSLHYDADISKKAGRLWRIIQHYGNVTHKPLDAKTAAINDLLGEFKSADLAAILVSLKMGDWAEKLGQENALHQEMMMARYGELSSRTHFRMKTTRKETDKYFRAIINDIENNVLAGNLPPEYLCFVAELNAIISRYKNILAQGQRKNGKDDDSDSGEIIEINE